MAQFGIHDVQVPPVSISDWSEVPASIGISSPYHISAGDVAFSPRSFGDYSIELNGGNRIDSIVLPNAPEIKILAMTLVK
jgi:hypothetical protein